MAVNYFVRQSAAGAGDGSTFDDAFTLADAVAEVNGLTVTEDVHVLICEDLDLTLVGTIDPLTRSGNTTGTIFWEGRDSTNGTNEEFRIIDGGATAARVFGFCETVGLTFEYHHWKNLEVTNLELTGDKGCWHASNPTCRRLSWYQCRARNSAYGFKFNPNDTMEECIFVGCIASGNSNDGFSLCNPT